MASPDNFVLDRSIFNATFYSRIRDFWFAHLPAGATAADDKSQAMWFGQGQTEHQKNAFDDDCRKNFRHALEAVTPDKYVIPPFESYERDIEEASSICKPFLADVKEAQAQDEKDGADTLQALLLLFDQISRNVYREPEELPLIFKHYDRIAFSLLHSSMNLSSNPLDHESYLRRHVLKQPCLLPLMHSEHLASHDLFLDITRKQKQAAESADDQAAVHRLDESLTFEAMHYEPLQKFGRYPHRNQALGRENTKEEVEYLSTAQTFGVKQTEKSEL